MSLLKVLGLKPEQCNDSALMGEARGALSQVQQHPEDQESFEVLNDVLHELGERGYEPRVELTITEFRQKIF